MPPMMINNAAHIDGNDNTKFSKGLTNCVYRLKSWYLKKCKCLSNERFRYI